MGGYVWRGDPALVELNQQIMAARPDPGRPKYGRGEAPHGTDAAYRRHRHGEDACPACVEAARLRSAARKANGRRVA